MIEEVESPINGPIQILKVFGRPKMVIAGLEQSGAFIGGIWKKGLKKISNFKFLISNVLVLGLGGGTVAQLINKFWPEAKIVGVEIDPVVIKLGKKHFELDKIPNLKIVNADAIEKIKNEKLKMKNFDLILVDLYIGDQVPSKAESQEFLQRIKEILVPGGLAIFNRLFYKEKKKETENFIKRLERIFPKIFLTRTPSNLLIFTQKRYN